MLLQVLVPHKNQPNKLIRLLESIPLEVNVIVVDDNSDSYHFDACKQAVDERFGNVVLLRNDTGVNNAGVARNLALAHANAEWVIFADSDDQFYTENFLELMGFIEKSDADLVFFDVDSIKEGDGTPSDRANPYSGLIDIWPLNKNTIAYQWVVPWGKVIRKSELIDKHGLRFASRIVSNDVEFATDLAVVSDNVDVFKGLVYCCFESNTSLTGSLTSEKARVRLHASSIRNITLYKNSVPIHYNYNIQFFVKSLPLIFKELDILTVVLFLKNLCVSSVGNFLNVFRRS